MCAFAIFTTDSSQYCGHRSSTAVRILRSAWSSGESVRIVKSQWIKRSEPADSNSTVFKALSELTIWRLISVAGIVIFNAARILEVIADGVASAEISWLI